MPVEGKVMVAGQKAAGAVVTLYKNGQQIQQVVTTSNGKFTFDLLPNAEFIISITKPGYITKKFKIVTANVPADRAEGGNFNPFQPDVTLFEMPTSPEISKRVEAILSQPIAIYQYIPSENNFNYDQKYTDMIQGKLSELADLQKQVEKEMQDKAKNAALDAQKQLEIDNKYKAAVAKGDKALATSDYPTAKAGYNEALGIKSGEAYPKQKLSEIDKLMAGANAQKEIDAKYKAAIAKGDGSFGTKDYAGAKNAYTEASGIKPMEAYPKQKIAEIDKLLADASKQKELDAKYQAAVSKGDGSMGSKDYTSAKAAFTDASEIKPAEQYPKTKLAEIDKLLADAGKQKDIDAKYQSAIAKADGAFSSKDYTSAKTAYTEASGIKPSESYPKSKIAECDKLLAETANAAKQKEIDAKYLAAVSKGDGSFSSKDYASAKSAYTEASVIKPAEAYPKTKIAEIDKLLGAAEADKLKEQQYKDAISKADAAFGSKDYAGAKSSYTIASGVKPAEQYPKTKIAEIDKLLGEMAKAGALDKQYKDFITKGDNFFAQKNYASAKSSFQDALALKSSEPYPKQKIAEIDKLMADLNAQKSAAEIDQKYNDAIAKGDKAFAAKDYTTAKQSYTEASGVKPAEPYPKSKLSVIDKMLASAAAQKELDEKYKAAVAKGDASFGTKDYASAQTAFLDAAALKPFEVYPKQKLSEIDKLLAASELASQESQRYKELITKGDQQFVSKEYSNAKTYYTQALGIKNEAYPKTKIAECDKLMKDQVNDAASQELNTNFLGAIGRGDIAFKERNYANAKAAYNEALTYKPNEQYPKDRIAEIEKIEKASSQAQADKELNMKYNKAIERGDNAFSLKDYHRAKPAYQEALTYKPNEKYPKDRLTQIETLLKAAQLAQNKKKDAPPPPTEEEKKKAYQTELRSKYPNGVTEEEYVEGGKTIIRRVVIKDDYAGIYMKVTHNWGGIYCFKDGAPISEIMFDNESR